MDTYFQRHIDLGIPQFCIGSSAFIGSFGVATIGSYTYVQPPHRQSTVQCVLFISFI